MSGWILYAAILIAGFSVILELRPMDPAEALRRGRHRGGAVSSWMLLSASVLWMCLTICAARMVVSPMQP